MAEAGRQAGRQAARQADRCCALPHAQHCRLSWLRFELGLGLGRALRDCFLLTAGGMFLVRSSASTCVSFSSEMKVSAQVCTEGFRKGTSRFDTA